MEPQNTSVADLSENKVEKVDHIQVNLSEPTISVNSESSQNVNQSGELMTG